MSAESVRVNGPLISMSLLLDASWYETYPGANRGGSTFTTGASGYVFSRTYSIVFYIKLHIFWHLLLWDDSLYFSILLFSDTQGTHTSTDSRTAIPTLQTTIPRNRTVTRTTLQVAAQPDPATRRMVRATPQKQVAPPPVLVRRNRKRARTTTNSRNNSSNRNRNRHSLSSHSSPRTGAQEKKSWSIFFCSNFLRQLVLLFLTGLNEVATR